MENTEYTIEELKFELTSLEDRTTSPQSISEFITFSNSHNIAYHLYHGNPEAARALFAELSYWIHQENRH